MSLSGTGSKRTAALGPGRGSRHGFSPVGEAGDLQKCSRPWSAQTLAHSDASDRLFRLHPVSQSGVSGHLRIIAAQAVFLMSGRAAFGNVFGGDCRAPHRLAVEFAAVVHSLANRLCRYAHPDQLSHWIPALTPTRNLRNRALARGQAAFSTGTGARNACYG